MALLYHACFGAFAASVLWLFVVAWMFDRLSAMRDELSKARQTLQLYRATREEAGAQIRELLEQNTRLACQLIDAKASTTTPIMKVPASFFREGRES